MPGSEEKVSPIRFTLALGPPQRLAFPPASFFCSLREAAAAEEGAEAEAEAAPRGRDTGGLDHRSDNFFPAAAAAGTTAAGSGSAGQSVGLRGR